MGSTGFILGGLLSGVGAGMQQDIAAKREAALADLRAQREAQNITLKAGYDAKNQEASDDRKNAQQIGLLKMGGAIDMAKIGRTGEVEANVVTPAKSAAEIAKIQAQGGVDQATQAQKDAAETQRAVIVEKLKQSGDAAQARLAREIAGTEVQSTYTNDKGNLVLVAKGGRVITTNIRSERPKGGGDEGDLLGDRSPASVAPSGVPAAPMSGRLSPKPAAAEARPQLVATKADRDRLYAEAAMKKNSDRRFMGKTDSQIKAIIDDGLRNKGYTIR